VHSDELEATQHVEGTVNLAQGTTLFTLWNY